MVESNVACGTCLPLNATALKSVVAVSDQELLLMRFADLLVLPSATTDSERTPFALLARFAVALRAPNLGAARLETLVELRLMVALLLLFRLPPLRTTALARLALQV